MDRTPQARRRDRPSVTARPRSGRLQAAARRKELREGCAEDWIRTAYVERALLAAAFDFVFDVWRVNAQSGFESYWRPKNRMRPVNARPLPSTKVGNGCVESMIPFAN